ncbi:MAG: S41 family peptidase [Chitinophagaceae bacterium]|nr:S41 family peptidase [Chitinophagaceae bacterium]
MCLPNMFLIGALSMVFASAINAQKTTSLTELEKQRVIDSFSKVLNRNYVYSDKALLMSQFIQQKHQNKGYKNMNDPKQWAHQITKDIRAIEQDHHLSVRFDPDLEASIRIFEATLEKETTDFGKEKSQNFFFRKAEILKGNIGYINFTNFADTNYLSRKTVQAAFQFVANAEALILDLRNNFGGRPEMEKEIAGYFFNEPQQTGRTYNRILDTWTEEWVVDQLKHSEGLYLTMPLYILTSKRTFSAAEGFAYNLKYLKNAILVGDTTRGAAHTTRSFALGNGFVGFIPFTRFEHIITKTDWERIGVVPSISISEELSLYKAQELILKNKLLSISDTTEQLKVQWLLNDLYSRMRKINVPNETLKQYTGVFEEFLFTLEEGKLFCRNTHQQDKKDMLVAINDHVFKIDEQSHVEFVTDKQGMVTSIRLLWDDGWVDTVQKSK